MNPTILDVVKKEVTKLLATEIIYPISDSQWVSPMQVVSKKSRITVMTNQHDELRICIDYRRLNQATRKDQFPLPFIDQVLEKLTGKSHYYFLYGFFGYMEIHIAPEDQHKTTFTCPFGTFANTRMPFGLCNSHAIWPMQHTEYKYLLGPSTGVHGGVHGRLHVTKGYVLGHLVSNRGIEVDKSKIDIITSLPNPTTVRKVRSFLGHVGFYRRFIKNFSKTALPLSKLLQKDMEFKFDQPSNSHPPLFCKHPIGSCHLSLCKPVHVIAYASRTMDPAQLNYTTTEKELFPIILVQEDKCQAETDPVDVSQDKKSVENLVGDHLSRIEREADPMPIRDEFPDEQLLHITMPTPWFVDICNFFPPEASRLYKERLQTDAKYYIWDDPNLRKLCNDQVIRWCILDIEIN
ncbi:Retrovirus-related Pol polyprotein from transposon 17.6, partial [Mucuna pruriens]